MGVVGKRLAPYHPDMGADFDDIYNQLKKAQGETNDRLDALLKAQHETNRLLELLVEKR
jgi:hypothetical protein